MLSSAAWCRVLSLAILTAAPSLVRGSTQFRASLLELARSRINVFYSNKANLLQAKESQNIKFVLSKDDKTCGGEGVPLTFLEFDIDGARPVDAFNIISDIAKETSWDPTCTSVSMLGDFKENQAFAAAGTFSAKPFAAREIYEWMVVDANFSTEEFWVIMSSLDNDELHQRKPPMGGAIQMENCLAAYRLTRTPNGTHVINTQQLNSHPWPLHARDVASIGWSASIEFGSAFRQKALEQFKLGWNATRTVLPRWMMEDKPCGPPAPSVEMRSSVLQRAEIELHRVDKGEQRPNRKLGNGEVLQLWRRASDCGGGDVKSAATALWSMEFKINHAAPQDVFNLLVAKSNESRWNAAVARADVSVFHGGARAVHEALDIPSVKIVTPHRELWEWQAARHFLQNGTYQIALTSTKDGQQNSPKFFSNSQEAWQCLAAYELTPHPDGGTLVRMTSNFNVNAGILSPLAKGVSESMLVEFAEALVAAAEQYSHNHQSSRGPMVDPGALQLLVPNPPDRNQSVTIKEVLHAKEGEWLTVFAQLDVPQVLNTTAWPMEEFDERSRDLSALLQRLAYNATAVENATIAKGRATTMLHVQLQGEVLAAIQMNVFIDLARKECAGGAALPDIDGNKGEGGLDLRLIIGLSVAALAVLATACTCCCCVKRARRRRLAAQADSTSLLDARARDVQLQTTAVIQGK